MSRRVLAVLTLSLLTLSLLTLVVPLLVPLSGASAAHIPRANSPAAPSRNAAPQSDYGRLPLAFEVNAGQAGASARFIAHGSGYTLALTPSEALLALHHPGATPVVANRFALPGRPASPTATPSTLLGMRWLSANPDPVVTGEDPLPGTVNYFIGNDPAQWHTNVPTYEQVRYHNIYPGVDLVYYGNQGQLEYDFVVAPGANPSAIQFSFTGAPQMGVDLLGNMSLTLPGGSLDQAKPLIYQTVNGVREHVEGGYALSASQHIGFALGTYNPRLPLVIDPAYQFSTYLGGNSDDGAGSIAVDGGGNAYITGATLSTNFPTVDPIQNTNAGGANFGDVFVSKLNAAGTALMYSTYLGGSADDLGNGIAVDAAGNAYVVGQTASTNFPVKAGAPQTTYGGGTWDTFAVKLNASGSAIDYSTYLGGGGADYGFAVAVDSSGRADLVGETTSINFPTVNAYHNANFGGEDGIVAQLNATGTALNFATYLGGSGNDWTNDVALDSSGNLYVTGVTYSTNFPTTPGAYQSTCGCGPDDAYVTRIDVASPTMLADSTFLGGSLNDGGVGIALDGSGNVYMAGDTASSNFPTTAGAPQTSYGGGYNDGIVSKFNATLSILDYSTYLGGSGQDNCWSIAVDRAGDAVVTGQTASTNFPTANPLQASFGGGTFDAFVTRLNASGTGLLYSSYLGGNGFDEGAVIAVNAGGDAYITGQTNSTNFPIASPLSGANAGGYDAFVTKLSVRPSNGNLYLKNSNSTGYADITLDYGLPGDKPVTGDWIGQGYHTIGVDRNGKFLLRNTNTTGYANITLAFGNSTDLPVAGDWTGKGYDSIGVFRSGTWYLRNTNTTGGPDITVHFGASGDLPVVGDWTGKGYDSIGVFRPSLGTFFLRNSNTTGPADITLAFGASGDLPVAGDWTAKGYDSIGIYRNGTYFLRNTNTTGTPDISFTLGIMGDQPITGPWLAPVGGLPPVHRGPSTPAVASAALPGAPRLHQGG